MPRWRRPTRRRPKSRFRRREPSGRLMPELPEVETVARDLRGLVVGATISGVRVGWLRTLRSQDTAAFRAGAVGRRIVGTSRRAKLVVLDLDDGSAITIHLK